METKYPRISDIEHKTVRNLVAAYPPEVFDALDAYHRAIALGAHRLRRNNLWDWEYFTQWRSGTTVWMSGNGGSLVVTNEGDLG